MLTDKTVDPKISKKYGKGYRLTILHMIIENEPLVELYLIGTPADDLKWKGDTYHPKKGQMRS